MTSAPAALAKKPFLGPTQVILLSMAIGITIGTLFPAAEHPNVAVGLKAVSSVFLRMIKSLIVPLLFSTLVVGIAGHGDDMKKVGRLAWRSILYFEVVTTLALVIGLAAVNLVKPGAGVSLAGASTEQAAEFARTKVTFSGVIEHMVPASFFDAAAHNEVLQIVFFSILFAVGLSRVSGAPKEFMLKFCESLAEVMFKFTGLVMAFAPFGIGAAIATTVGQSGLDVLRSLGLLVLTLYGALVVFALLVLWPVAMVARVPVRRFWSFVKEPWLIAFSSASSEAALPKAMEQLEKFGIPRRIIAFVLPTGYSFNLDGTSIYLSMAALFIAQVYGVELSIGQQLSLLGVLMLTSKGAAGVTGSGFIVLASTLAATNIVPVEGVAILLGVDRFMSEARTVTNLIGNGVATLVIARSEGAFDDARRVAAEAEG